MLPLVFFGQGKRISATPQPRGSLAFQAIPGVFRHLFNLVLTRCAVTGSTPWRTVINDAYFGVLAGVVLLNETLAAPLCWAL